MILLFSCLGLFLSSYLSLNTLYGSLFCCLNFTLLFRSSQITAHISSPYSHPTLASHHLCLLPVYQLLSLLPSLETPVNDFADVCSAVGNNCGWLSHHQHSVSDTSDTPHPLPCTRCSSATVCKYLVLSHTGILVKIVSILQTEGMNILTQCRLDCGICEKHVWDLQIVAACSDVHFFYCGAVYSVCAEPWVKTSLNMLNPN